MKTRTAKLCRKCNLKKPIAEFYKHKRDGCSSSCKACIQQTPKKPHPPIRTLKQRFTMWKENAKKRDIVFTLTIEDLEALPMQCYYTGIIPTLEPNHVNTISLDRIDSNRGYVAGNVVFTVGIVNKSKQDMTVKQFVMLCRKVATHLRDKL